MKTNIIPQIKNNRYFISKSKYFTLFYRILKPFIRRDYESKAKKMSLLEEIKAYPYR